MGTVPISQGKGDSPHFKDHFSGHAASYAAYRPGYPRELFRFLADCCDERRQAWDCATGNGQTAVQLAHYFDRVVATDASAAQVAAASAHPKVRYGVATAERSGLDGRSIDLITVAQALHWFDLDRFFAEARRVLVPGGVLAAWSYGLCRVEPEVDALVLELYRDLDPYWPPERRIVDEGYRGIELPMPPIPSPGFDMSLCWSAEAMLGYLRTWSASQRCLRDRGADPVAAIADRLRGAWGGGERAVRWPLAIKLGRNPAV
ncbi:MAG TPA: class I SAM-dependent methyltransferase [Woeseiaceae bacterium]|nr:class I SAM-dependent methyltransferase [Woeseiaceae bacterium]